MAEFFPELRRPARVISMNLPRISRLILLLVVSILLPGCLLFAEAIFLIKPNGPSLRSLEIHADAYSILVVTAIAAVVYLLGLASRSVGFRIASFRREFGMPFPTLDEVYENALSYVSEDCIRRSLENTGVVGEDGELLRGYIHYCKFWLRLLSHWRP
jgi:hypothetical protein